MPQAPEFPRRLGVLCTCIALTMSVSLSGQDNAEKPLYKDPSQPVEKRVSDLIAKMTLEEKVSQLGHTADAVSRLSSFAIAT